MATTVDSEQVKAAVRERTAELQPTSGLRAVAAAPDVATPAHRRPRTRSATRMRNAWVSPKGPIWAWAVETLKRSPN